MTEVALFRGPTNLASPASRGSSSSSSTSLRYLADSDVLQRGTTSSAQTPAGSAERQAGGSEEEEEDEERWSFLALLLELLRKSLLRCRAEDGGQGHGQGQGGMEIGLPTDVQHVAHVTFDRFHGFLGLPVEFEPEVPRRAPSASASVFGVSTQSMQCSYDSRGNSVPTILLMMQRRLYEQGGLRAEGIFRINAENSQEEFVRDHLNSGTVPDGIDVHCLAGLIKAWFRELPSGVLDSIPPEQVMQCQSEEDCARVAKCLPPTEAALLDWAVNLMADVVQEEQINKMSDRNVAMVFAPNMTQMADPLTALMYAVQVMNFLKMLIQKTLKDREESNLEEASLPQKDPSDENGHQNPSLPVNPQPEEISRRPSFVSEEPLVYSPTHSAEDKPSAEGDSIASIVQTSNVRLSVEGSASCAQPAIAVSSAIADASCTTAANLLPSRGNRSMNSRRTRKGKRQCGTPAAPPAEKSRGASIVSRINSKPDPHLLLPNASHPWRRPQTPPATAPRRPPPATTQHHPPRQTPPVAHPGHHPTPHAPDHHIPPPTLAFLSHGSNTTTFHSIGHRAATTSDRDSGPRRPRPCPQRRPTPVAATAPPRDAGLQGPAMPSRGDQALQPPPPYWIRPDPAAPAPPSCSPPADAPPYSSSPAPLRIGSSSSVVSAP